MGRQVPHLRRPLLALAGIVLLAGALSSGSEEVPTLQEAPAFEVFHMNSARAPGPSMFEEIFVVDAVRGGLDVRIEDVELRIDGKPANVTWAPPEGPLQRNATFSFVQEAFDQQPVLTGHVGELQVMECRFGGAAGRGGLHPDELRAMGEGHLVRCLDELYDG